MVKPSERLIAILIEWPVQIKGGSNGHFFWTFPVLKSPDVTGKMEAIKPPIDPYIGWYLSIFKIHRALLIEFVTQIIKDQIHQHGIGARIRIGQGILQVGDRIDLWIGESFPDCLEIFFFAPRLLERIFCMKMGAVVGFP